MGLPPLVRQSQARRWNRIRHNFPQSQGPVARRGFRPATQILRAGTFLPGPRGNPRKWGPGKGDYEHKVLIWSRPRRRFAQSLVAPGEAQRSGFAGKRRSKGTNAVFAARRKRSGVDFATTSRRGQSHSPPAGGEIPLRGTKPLYHRPLIRPSVHTGAPSPQGEDYSSGAAKRSFAKSSLPSFLLRKRKNALIP